MNNKIDFLKAEYKNYLMEWRRELIINHFKHYRTYCPVTLKATLLDSKRLYLLPGYSHFRLKADETVKAAAESVETKLYELPNEAENLMDDLGKQANEFYEKLRLKYYPEYPVFYYGVSDKENERKQSLMILLMIDEGK